MEIIWHGYSCFTLKTKRGTVVIDPYDSEVTGLKLPNLKADVVLVSNNYEGHNNVKAVQGDPKIIDWPGEYDIRGIAVSSHPIPLGAAGGEAKNRKGQFFTIEDDGIRVCFMGDIGGVPDEALIESIGDIDILMIPVGGNTVTDAKMAHRVIEELEPRAVIPMHYAVPGSKGNLDGVEPFLKLVGGNPQPRDKFVITGRSELKEDAMECIVLNPQTA
jgi:L-ascorbate metabolism protein UlaG (beta-lactamase superfamily)